mmetsp:Transcript_43982/g.116285  ORF Transcript_43982/g.116285 Transcript_43982/m.116285 type:complete len:276 (-) Transcript_43982:88-915(-)
MHPGSEARPRRPRPGRRGRGPARRRRRPARRELRRRVARGRGHDGRLPAARRLSGRGRRAARGPHVAVAGGGRRQRGRRAGYVGGLVVPRGVAVALRSRVGQLGAVPAPQRRLRDLRLAPLGQGLRPAGGALWPRQRKRRRRQSHSMPLDGERHLLLLALVAPRGTRPSRRGDLVGHSLARSQQTFGLGVATELPRSCRSWRFGMLRGFYQRLFSCRRCPMVVAQNSATTGEIRPPTTQRYLCLCRRWSFMGSVALRDAPTSGRSLLCLAALRLR